MNKVITTFCVLICLSSLFFSCFLLYKKQKQPLIIDGGNVLLEDVGSDIYEITSDTQLWHEENSVISIVFGYGYNDKAFVENMCSSLYETYGSYEDGGVIFPLVFPEDFKHGSKVYITSLENLLSDKNVRGLILLGAPENTHKAIARIEDKFGGTLPFPVFSFFSQDDIVGMEDSATFVLDKAQTLELNGIAEEEEQTYIEEIPEILARAVSFQLYSDAPFKKDKSLIELVALLSPSLEISRYIDSDSNLPSINHFIIK